MLKYFWSTLEDLEENTTPEPCSCHWSRTLVILSRCPYIIHLALGDYLSYFCLRGLMRQWPLHIWKCILLMTHWSWVGECCARLKKLLSHRVGQVDFYGRQVLFSTETRMLLLRASEIWGVLVPWGKGGGGYPIYKVYLGMCCCKG